MADEEYSTPLPQGAQVGDSAAPSGGQNQQQPDSSGGDEYSTPLPQDAQVDSQSFQTPGGRSYKVGQQVQHSSGATGTVTGQHPDSKNAIVDWGKHVMGFDNGPGEVVKGAAKGLAETGQGLQHAAGLDNTFWGGGQESHIDTEAKNNAQAFGKAGETIAEFISGDEALKALSWGDRMLTTGKMMKTLEESPQLMKALRIGIGSLRSGVVGGAQGFAKSGGDVGQAVQEGLGSAAGSALLGTAGSVVGGQAGGGASAASDVAKQGIQDLEALPGKVAAKARKIYPEPIPAENPVTAKNTFESSIQGHYDQLHGHLQDIADKVAEDEGVTDKVKPATSVRDYFHNVGDAVEGKAKSLYQNIDSAMKKAGIAQSFQKLDATIDDLGSQMDAAYDGNNTKLYDELSQQMDEQVKLRNSIKPALKDAGIPEDAPDKANAIYKRAQALKDLGVKTTNSTDGLRPEFADSTSTPERVNPTRLHNNIEKLYDNKRYGGRRLQQALGDDAGRLLRSADDTKVNINNATEMEAQRKLDLIDKRTDVKRHRNLVKGAAIGTAAAALGSGLVHHATTAAEIAAGAQ